MDLCKRISDGEFYAIITAKANQPYNLQIDSSISNLKYFHIFTKFFLTTDCGLSILKLVKQFTNKYKRDDGKVA